MNEVTVFKHEQFGNLRTVKIGGEAWFVGKDVAEALGYSNSSKAVIVHVDDSDKIKEILAHSQNRNMVKTQTTLINESGMYALIFGSKLESARKFKHWVTSEVLPTIRKHGAYMNENTLEQALTSPDFLIQLATQLKAEKEKREKLQETLEVQKPKVLFADSVTASKTSILVGDLAKFLKQNGVEIGAKRLFEWMRENGYLIKRKGSDWNMPTQYSMERKLFEIKETTHANADGSIRISRTPKVTGKGQVYFTQKFLQGQN